MPRVKYNVYWKCGSSRDRDTTTVKVSHGPLFYNQIEDKIRDRLENKGSLKFNHAGRTVTVDDCYKE